MKTPKHWQNRNLLALVLFPLGCLYAFATWVRIKFNQPRKVKFPVICIGNLTVGGSGKTPTAVSIARILKQAGKNPFFVSRGYGGNLQDVVVDLEQHSPQEVGDEPLLLAREASVIVNHRRYDAALKAVENGADIIIMDDGFQNPALYKDKSLLVIDGNVGMGNLLPIPAGPMREFLHNGIKRAQAVIILGEDKTNILPKLGNIPVFRGNVVEVKPITDNNVIVAFAGIGRPQKFYQSLEKCGLNPIKTIDFPDHHFYTRNELLNIINEADKLGADIYTTAKDMVKIPHNLRDKFRVLEIEIKWKNEAELKEFLLN